MEGMSHWETDKHCINVINVNVNLLYIPVCLFLRITFGTVFFFFNME